MMHPILLRRPATHIVVGLLMLLAPAVAAAQSDDAVGPTQTQSILTIILTGAGWIGIVIFTLSLISTTFIIQHFWTIRRKTMIPNKEVEVIRDLIEKRDFKACIDHVSESKSMFGDVLTLGLRHGRHGFDAMREAVEERANTWRSKLFRRIEYLNIIGNLCPLLGLLGTVLGMIMAFAKMHSSGGAYDAPELAEGISLALVSTFLGLIVAIVSLGFFGLCRNRVDSMTVAAEAAVVDMLEYFRPPIGSAGVPQTTNG